MYLPASIPESTPIFIIILCNFTLTLYACLSNHSKLSATRFKCLHLTEFLEKKPSLCTNSLLLRNKQAINKNETKVKAWCINNHIGLCALNVCFLLHSLHDYRFERKPALQEKEKGILITELNLPVYTKMWFFLKNHTTAVSR